MPTRRRVPASIPCRAEDLRSRRLSRWTDAFRPTWDPDGTDPKPRIMHRKMWEWVVIATILDEAGMLAPGRTGVGFGVGTEPLVAAFAERGVDVLATDLPPDGAAESGWISDRNEWSGGIDGLNVHGLCSPERFSDNVRFRFVDMRDLPADLGTFDFSWSSCAMEHLGSLEAGLDFVKRQLDFVRPGGLSVHTTELNVSSDDATVDDGPTVLYRRRDLETLRDELRARGHAIRLDLRMGSTPDDEHVDAAPFTATHLRTALGDFVTTSFSIVVRKNASFLRIPRFRR